MIFVFDNSSLSKLKHFYPNVFKSVWDGLDTLVKDGSLTSTREVWNELERGEPHPYTNDWLKDRKHIFAIPTPDELQFVSTIFAIPHFQSLIGMKQQLRGTPVADPFVIAAAKIRKGTVVTEEAFKPNASRIPNVCDHFKIPCINLEDFMSVQGWVF